MLTRRKEPRIPLLAAADRAGRHLGEIEALLAEHDLPFHPLDRVGGQPDRGERDGGSIMAADASTAATAIAAVVAAFLGVSVPFIGD